MSTVMTYRLVLFLEWLTGHHVMVIPYGWVGAIVSGPDTTAHVRKNYKTVSELTVYMPVNACAVVHAINGAKAYNQAVVPAPVD